MEAIAVVLQAPEQLGLQRLALTPPGPDHLVVDIEWSGISTGTERLLWSGKMPPFPGLGYPLVPGYESVGRIVEVPSGSSFTVGARVFVPGASCFGEVRGLFGGAASRLVVPASRVVAIPERLGEEGVLLALAATAHHAIVGAPALPELIVGHGVLGRLLARVTVALGGQPTVWENNPERRRGAEGYNVVASDQDDRRNYRCIHDVSGDAAMVEPLLGRLAKTGELVLAGFYSDPIRFAFPLAFLKEARLRVAAEWQPSDLVAVTRLINEHQLRLDGLITHRRPYEEAGSAYRTAFEDPTCLKMLLDWRACS
ncbi:MAG: chlorophyll synthesis pathway protein BchC [Deltaproteobacteria bacterium]|jgi:3-hydroxyethyl bacteriochlorophyllide a dehydrogenase|nr:chlorophyll synthesis pathway protein BchC [Deltaproteobacteria bacterium]